MNKYKIIISITVLLLLINTTLLVLLWSGKKTIDDRAGRGPAMVEDLLKEKLSLTEDQLKQFRVLREDHFSLNRKLLDSLRIQKDLLFSMLGKTAASSSTVDSVTNIISGYEKQKDLNTFSHFSKVRAILNPAQQENFDKVINDILRMIAGPQPGMRNPPGPRGDRPGPPPGEGPPPPGEDHPPK